MAVKRGRASGRAVRDAAAARGVRERIDGFSVEKEAVFLAELEKSGCVTDACRVADISTTSVTRHRRFRPAFDAACKLARVKARGPLEAIAWMRAVEGTPTKIIRKGKVVEERIKPSDAMLKTLMAAADPAKYGRGGGATPEQIAALKAEWEAERDRELTEEEEREVIDRLLRKMRKFREKMFRQGMGLTVRGETVPIGYGPISPDAAPLVPDPLNYTPEQELEDFIQQADEAEREKEARFKEARGLG
ncbi:MAG TPA: hypothetical protein VGC35_09155 [Allosphingosinicella sp.]